MQGSHDTYLALRTRLPADQALNTYYANVHRDWSWGQDENEASLKQIESDGHVATTTFSPGPGRRVISHVRRLITQPRPWEANSAWERPSIEACSLAACWNRLASVGI